MTDDEDRDHRYSEGRGFEDPYGAFDLEPPEFQVDPDEVDPVDSHVVSDLLDERQIAKEDVDVGSLIDVGLSYMQINRHEQATEAFARAAMFAEEDSPLEAEAWVNKGVAHAELEEYDEAAGSHREALRADDRGEHAALAETNLSYALWELGEDDEAFYHAERSVELDERFPQAWYNRGFMQIERGLAEEALRSFDNAIRLGMRSVDVYEEKARALEMLGREEEAEEVAAHADELREHAEDRLIE